ncbi:antitoxin, HigA [Pontimonas salivibrio]|uniref:Antitoxin, HigA n=1 Tax=Pontimonas salivibrio TaxID=1159327 RepID=A0A2L2BR55_9MICO|nr:XRE family transcriptional regulator [Pontimonas salivibrio]AVG24150.1 antitoxin, HigA [Pontimonas salivibrio]
MSDAESELAQLSDRLRLSSESIRRERESLEKERTAYQLRALRRARGLTQVELAGRLGVSQNRVSRLERGEIQRVRIDTLARYVESLGGSLQIEMRVGDAHYPLVVAHEESVTEPSGADPSNADESSEPAAPLWQEATTRGR